MPAFDSDRLPCPSTSPRRHVRAALLVLACLALAWACGAAKTKLYDRDIGLSDAPLGRHIAREPLEGELLDGWNSLRKGFGLFETPWV